MLHNPQIKFQGLPNKGYLFPKYQGKFFVVKNQKIKQKRPNHSLSSSKPMKPLIFQKFPKQDYKEMKVQAQYMKKIQELKKKLQRQICKYAKQRDNNLKITNKLNAMLQGEYNSPHSHSYRMLYDQSEFDRPDISRQQQRKSQLKKMRRKYAMRIPFKNNSEIKRRMKTDMDQSIQSYRGNFETQFLTNRSSISIKSKQSNHLPIIPKKQNSPQSKHTFSISSSIRYSLPSRIFKSQTKKKIQIQEDQIDSSFNRANQNQVRVSTQVINRNHQYDSINEQLKMRAMGIGLKRKNFDSKIKKKEVNPRQTFLNGWEFSNDRQSDQINYLQ